MTENTSDFDAPPVSPGEILFRRAERSDMIEVAAVFRKARLEALPYLPDLHTPEEDRQFFSNVVFNHQRIHIAERDEVIIGFIAFNDDCIDHLYLLPEARGKGIGSQLLEIAKFRSERLQLWTFQRNENAKRFYAKNGFKIIRETDGADNEEKEPDVLLEWRAE